MSRSPSPLPPPSPKRPCESESGGGRRETKKGSLSLSPLACDRPTERGGVGGRGGGGGGATHTRYTPQGGEEEEGASPHTRRHRKKKQQPLLSPPTPSSNLLLLLSRFISAPPKSSPLSTLPFSQIYLLHCPPLLLSVHVSPCQFQEKTQWVRHFLVGCKKVHPTLFASPFSISFLLFSSIARRRRRMILARLDQPLLELESIPDDT